MDNMTIEDIIKELEYLKCKKNAEFDYIMLTSKSRCALNYAIKAIKDQQNKLNFCPHCGSNLSEVD